MLRAWFSIQVIFRSPSEVSCASSLASVMLVVGLKGEVVFTSTRTSSIRCWVTASSYLRGSTLCQAASSVAWLWKWVSLNLNKFHLKVFGFSLHACCSDMPDGHISGIYHIYGCRLWKSLITRANLEAKRKILKSPNHQIDGNFCSCLSTISPLVHDCHKSVCTIWQLENFWSGIWIDGMKGHRLFNL